MEMGNKQAKEDDQKVETLMKLIIRPEKQRYDEDDYDQYFWEILKEHIIKKRIKENNIKETYKLLEQFLPTDIIKYNIKDYCLNLDYEWNLHNLGLKIVKNVYEYNKYTDSISAKAYINKAYGVFLIEDRINNQEYLITK
jgi:hypothetical protein